MLTYCEPWPVNRNATLGAGPRPTKTPCERSSFHIAGLFAANAPTALSAFLASSAASAKSIATRIAASASAGSGATAGGVRPSAAAADRAFSWATTSASSRPPTTAAPRRGALRATGVAGAAALVGAAVGAAVVSRDPGMSAPANARGASWAR